MVRSARPEDAEALLDIYSYYVEETAITFEYERPGIEEFRARIKNTLKRYPYLLYEEEGEILGYAYAGPLKDRAAYHRSVETSIYVDKKARKGGIGRSLYEALEERLKKQDITNLYACIAYPIEEDSYLDRNSVDFHAHMGYRLIGRFHQCAWKFQTWYDMVWMEKFIAAHEDGDR